MSLQKWSSCLHDGRTVIRIYNDLLDDCGELGCTIWNVLNNAATEVWMLYSRFAEVEAPLLRVATAIWASQ